MRYAPFGGTRSSGGAFGTDRAFTGQRLDSTGLYFYNARYYDAAIGRFISPDTIVPNLSNPQSLNPYTYVLNNPLRYTDPTGHVEYDEYGEYDPAPLVGQPPVVVGVAVSVPAFPAVWVLPLLPVLAPVLIALPTLFIANDTGPSMLLESDEEKVVAQPQPTNQSTPTKPDEKRNELLGKATDPKLRDAIDQLYRPGSQVGDGGTADKIRIDGDHIQKGQDRLKQLESILSNPNLSPSDRQIAQSLHDDLKDALASRGALK
ncbi:MAG: hypothetical protein HY681_05830 [Chloroflexi bacterium]|nr:hypothetical protein [Chloroflexota bacterium]